MRHVNHAHSFEAEKALIRLGGAEPTLQGAPNRAKFTHKGEREHLFGVLETTAGFAETGPEWRPNSDAIEMVTDVARRERETVVNETLEPKAACEVGTSEEAPMG